MNFTRAVTADRVLSFRARYAEKAYLFGSRKRQSLALVPQKHRAFDRDLLGNGLRVFAHRRIFFYGRFVALRVRFVNGRAVGVSFDIVGRKPFGFFAHALPRLHFNVRIDAERFVYRRGVVYRNAASHAEKRRRESEKYREHHPHGSCEYAFLFSYVTHAFTPVCALSKSVSVSAPSSMKSKYFGSCAAIKARLFKTYITSANIPPITEINTAKNSNV